jgi:hypothetical protein
MQHAVMCGQMKPSSCAAAAATAHGGRAVLLLGGLPVGLGGGSAVWRLVLRYAILLCLLWAGAAAVHCAVCAVAAAVSAQCS